MPGSVYFHNSFFSLSDHMSSLIQNEFNGSNTANNVSCGRTKAVAVVNYSSDHFFKVWKLIYRKYLSVSSTETSISKIYPIILRIFYEKMNRVATKTLWHKLHWGNWCINRGSHVSKCWFTIDQSWNYLGLLSSYWTREYQRKIWLLQFNQA